jgi:hypothetical protein
MMKRNLWNCPKKVKEIAYTAIVRPKLEYGVERCWSSECRSRARPWEFEETLYLHRIKKTKLTNQFEYAAWDPYLQKDIASLERVQRKAARFCSNNSHPTASVTDMLHELGWTTLELRRTMTRLALLYKMS